MVTFTGARTFPNTSAGSKGTGSADIIPSRTIFVRNAFGFSTPRSWHTPPPHEAPLRSFADRIPARRRRAHRDLQSPSRAPSRRHDAAPHRGHGRRALAPASRGADRQLAAVARRGVGRRPDLSERSAPSISPPRPRALRKTQSGSR